MRDSWPRHGYAMLLVLLFMVVMLSLWSLAYRQTAAALRIETARAVQSARDQGSIHALARGLALLETGLPPSDPYVCGVTIETPSGPRSYTVTFAFEGLDRWSVHSAPTGPSENPEPMPAVFAPPP